MDIFVNIVASIRLLDVSTTGSLATVLELVLHAVIDRPLALSAAWTVALKMARWCTDAVLVSSL
jgi:hypothetical protein